jgi:toluene monooxygenase electron transfer component
MTYRFTMVNCRLGPDLARTMPYIKIESSVEFSSEPKEPILAGALRSGIAFPYSCASGTCGTCRFTLLDGEVANRYPSAPAWTDRDRARGRYLACQVSALEDLVISLRLDDSPPKIRPAQRKLEFRGREIVTPSMAELTFAVEGDDSFLPGQFALFDLESLDRPRAYSMSNLPGSKEWTFCVKRVPTGEATGVLLDLEPGAFVAVDGPYGNAYLRDNEDRDVLLVAGGSGLSPILSIASALADSSHDRLVHLVYGVRTIAEDCSRWILSRLYGLDSRLTYTLAVSDEVGGPGAERGFVHEVVANRYGSSLGDFEIYAAGPAPMIKAMQEVVAGAGVDLDRCHYDEF